MAIANKREFIKTFFPSVTDMHYAEISLDLSDLSLSDILRNVNRTFPLNSRNRNAISSGDYIAAVLCRSDLLYPLSGIFLLITNSENPIQLISKNYIVISIPEEDIRTDERIHQVLKGITTYLVDQFKESIEEFVDLYVKFIYEEDDSQEGIE